MRSPQRARRTRGLLMVAATSLSLVLITVALGTSPASAAAPPNDRLADAAPLTAGTAATGTTLDATTETGESSCAAGGVPSRSTWYRYTATDGAGISAATTQSTGGPPLDTIVGVWSGPSAAPTYDALVPVACDDDSGPGDFSLAFAPTTAGTTYYVQVALFSDSAPGGSFDVAVRSIPAPSAPANDDLASASPIPPEDAVTVDPRAATLQSGELSDPSAADCGATPRSSVWFRYRPAVDRTVYLSTTAPRGDAFIRVFTGPADAASPRALTLVACDRFGDGGFESDLTAGTTYYLAVGTTTTASGPGLPFSFTLEQPDAAPSATTLAAAATGSAVQLTATVDPDGPTTPAGTVTFYEGPRVRGSTPVGPTGTATTALPGEGVGPHTYTAVFTSTSATIGDSASAPATVTVGAPGPTPTPTPTLTPTPTPTVTPTTSPSPPPAAGRGVTFLDLRFPARVRRGNEANVRALVSPAVGVLAPPVTGTVTITYRGRTRSAPLVGGKAKFLVTIRSKTRVTATYVGTTVAAPSTDTGTIRLKKGSR